LGKFQVQEVISDWRKVGQVNNLIFEQSHLYQAEQPALFLYDACHVLYLWQGWRDCTAESGGESPGGVGGTPFETGSGAVRWHAERRAAMATIQEFKEATSRRRVRVELVWAGHEPRGFINLFPWWEAQEEVYSANKEFAKNMDFEMAFHLLSRTEYSWEELQVRPLPDGVDPSQIETYFQTVLFRISSRCQRMNTKLIHDGNK